MHNRKPSAGSVMEELHLMHSRVSESKEGAFVGLLEVKAYMGFMCISGICSFKPFIYKSNDSLFLLCYSRSAPPGCVDDG